MVSHCAIANSQPLTIYIDLYVVGFIIQTYQYLVTYFSMEMILGTAKLSCFETQQG